jgi:hypothetical protein
MKAIYADTKIPKEPWTVEAANAGTKQRKSHRTKGK